MNTRLITASVFTFFSASMVQAADVVISEPPEHVASPVVVSSFSWTGFYFGGQIGGFSSKASALTPNVNVPLYPDEDARKKEWILVEKKYMPEPSGFTGGFYAGINFDFGNHFIWGIDTDLLLIGRKDTKTLFKTEESEESEVVESGEDKAQGYLVSAKSRRGEDSEKSSITFVHTLKQKWNGATRVRVGYSAGRIMPYISGGVAYGKFQDILSTSITGAEPFNATSDVTRAMIGYTLGGGVDFAVTDKVIARAEYRYSDFGKKKFKDEIELKYKTNDLRIGLAYKF
ncbi:outer membrane protein [Bartonella vinsonii]|uniref:Hemin binding protein n=1 Tax=Bartonella vinsonii subsp. berkhoffii str. Tweed TaxID=1094502 RepID=N6VUH5_BARVB|nr:outer membrane protein [Bartonella vinsonii]ENN94747.1 hemin binding protein [Bartonella vinsonii subsp. berkhoffii str. Tweed]